MQRIFGRSGKMGLRDARRIHGKQVSCLAVAALICGIGPRATAGSADLSGARAFLTAVYSHYPRPISIPANQSFDPTGRSAAAVFDPSTVALIREDQRLSKGEVGALDGDPICDCQDDGGLVVAMIAMRIEDANHAAATVTLEFSHTSPRDIHILRFKLVHRLGRWRIHDIATKDTPSLRELLLRSIRSQDR